MQELMIKGEPYQASDPYVSNLRIEQAKKLWEINHEPDPEKYTALMRGLLNIKEGDFYCVTPFTCEFVCALHESADAADVLVGVSYHNGVWRSVSLWH